MLSNSTLQVPSVGSATSARARVTPTRVEQDTTAVVVARLRRARAGLESFHTTFPKLRPAIAALRRVESRLTRPLRVAIVGEFNSGKSSLANLLVGIDSVPTAIVSNTRIPTLLYHASVPEIFAVDVNGAKTTIDADNPLRATNAVRLEVGLPAERLKAVEFIDFPGLADPRFEDCAADLGAHGIDAVLWCTVATQAWKESERMAWSALSPRLHDRSILVVTHRDLLHNAQDEAKLLTRLRGDAGDEFRDIVMLSTSAGAEPPQIALPPDAKEAAREAGSLGTLEHTIDRLLDTIRQERGTAAIAATNRIAGRALARMAPT
ncbi:MAG: dynamin family protein [Hyphomicrobium sp.]